ncbi:MAG: hypothetical protein COB53_03695 [Elusimicrobia bacterium]|nr:MAG: hypothetical protein COB53_03695 [Elusimicrobiota bacterium]
MILHHNYQSLKAIAHGYLASNHQSGTIPIPIEEILDLRHGVNIAPLPGLQEVAKTVGFSSSDFKTITVDEFVYLNRPARYRFTLAHELSHSLLHSDLYVQRPFNTVDEWKQFVSKLDPLDYEVYEKDANDLAGLLLVPPGQLEVSAKIQRNKLAGRNDLGAVPDDLLRSYIANPIAREFDVSSQTVEIRLRRDRTEVRPSSL